MNTLTKSAIVAATIAGAAATSLRFEVAANSNFEQSLKMQSWETSFLEKAADAYDCVGTTLHQITEVAEKSAAAKTTVEAECALTGSRYVAAQTEHDATLKAITGLEEKRAAGTFPVEYECVANCDTPNTVRTSEKDTIEEAFKKSIEESDARVTASQSLVDAKQRKLTKATSDETTNDQTVATNIAAKTGDIQDRIDAIANQLTADKITASANKQGALVAAAAAKIQAKKDCDAANKDRLGVIAEEEKLLGEIKGDLETLRMCTARHKGGTEFLEIKAAQRLEAHCAVSQKKVAQAAPSGDLTDWLNKIIMEKNAAYFPYNQCYKDATATEREKIDLTPGINYEYTNAVEGYKQVADAKTKEEQKKIDAVTAEENKKKISFQQKKQSAQEDLDDQKEIYDAVVVDETKEKTKIKSTKETDDADADKRWTATLGDQKKYLDGQRTSKKAAFETTKKGIKAGCTKDIEELEAEGDTIAKVKAKIALLKVVGREPAKVIRPTEPGYVFEPSQTATSVSVGEENTWDAVIWGVPSTAYTVKYAITNTAGESTDQKEITCTFGGIAKPGCVGAQCDDTKDTVVISDKDGKIPLNTISKTGSHKIIEFKLTEAKAIEVVPSFDADYMVLTYEFKSGADLDTRTRMIHPDVGQGPAHPDNAVQMNTKGNTKNAVGWSYKTQWPETKPFLTWGGDNTGRGFESALLDIQEFKKAYPNAKDLTMDFRAFWFGTSGDLPVKLASHFFKGGDMVKDGYTWKNANAADQLSFDNQGSVVKSTLRTGPGERIATFNYNFVTGFGMFDNKDLKENK